VKKLLKIKINSIIKPKIEFVEYPVLETKFEIINKMISKLNENNSKILKYLSKELALSKIREYKIKIIKNGHEKEDIIKILKVWLTRIRVRRLVFIVFEGIILPFTPILAILPGPNVFFYIPALLIYFHFKTFISLNNLKFKDLDIEWEDDLNS